MTEIATCMGCMVQPNFHYPPVIWGPPPVLKMDCCFAANNGLTDQEKEVLSLLKDAWQKFSELGNHIHHDLTEFNYAIHLAQQKMALRVARRVDPEVWNQPQTETENEK